MKKLLTAVLLSSSLSVFAQSNDSTNLAGQGSGASQIAPSISNTIDGKVFNGQINSIVDTKLNTTTQTLRNEINAATQTLRNEINASVSNASCVNVVCTGPVPWMDSNTSLMGYWSGYSAPNGSSINVGWLCNSGATTCFCGTWSLAVLGDPGGTCAGGG